MKEDKIIQEEIMDYEKKLLSFAAEAKKASTLSLMVGILLAIIGVVMLVFLPLKNPCDDCEIKTKTFALSGILVGVLIELAAIVCFMAGKNSSKKADNYRNEIISLQDLTISLSLLKDMDDKKIEEEIMPHENSEKTVKQFRPSEQDKMRSLICQTLLNHSRH